MSSKTDLPDRLSGMLGMFGDIACSRSNWDDWFSARVKAVEGAAIFMTLNKICEKLDRIAGSLEVISDAEKKGGELADILTAFHEKEGE